jgi:hypothetical protein
MQILNCNVVLPEINGSGLGLFLVKQLREEIGAGMMDYQKALAETEGDLEKAQAYLRKKGLSSTDKKSGKLAAEGRIGTYIHDSRINVLIEVNCETDFAGISEKFKELVDDLAMQVAACPHVQFENTTYVCLEAHDSIYSRYSWFRSTFISFIHSSYFVYLGYNLISWSAKQQPTLSQSSVEVKYRRVASSV